MTQLTKVSTKPDHLSDDAWRFRLAEVYCARQDDDGHYSYPNLYAAVFIDLQNEKFVTTIIFNDEANRDALSSITNGFEKLHNFLTA